MKTASAVFIRWACDPTDSCVFPGMDLQGIHPDLSHPCMKSHPSPSHAICALPSPDNYPGSSPGPHTNMMRTMAVFCPGKPGMGHPCQVWVQGEHPKFREPGPVPGTLLIPVYTVRPCTKMSVVLQNNP